MNNLVLALQFQGKASHIIRFIEKVISFYIYGCKYWGKLVGGGAEL